MVKIPSVCILFTERAKVSFTKTRNTFLRIAFIQDFNKAKELAVNEDFLGRYGDGIYVAGVRGHNNQPTGVAMTQGSVWKHLRRFSLTTLKANFCC
jgi:hypothetical protein